MTRESPDHLRVASTTDKLQPKFEQLGRLAEEIERVLRGGHEPDLLAMAKGNEMLASELEQILPSIRALCELGYEPASALSAGQQIGSLGDFRIIRELARGGMGVVYEGEQISLRRRVALKVLPFAAMLDPRRLKRFQNEALAVAQLDHPNIVNVYGVGCDRGVHFYAMRYIDGRTLAEIISQLRDAPTQSEAACLEDIVSHGASGTGKHPEKTTVKSREFSNKEPASGPLGYLPTPATTVAASHDNTYKYQGHSTNAAMYRSIAQMAQHVAEALHEAHVEGVVHRDIKPSNLMLDSRGKVWVTDFGLAATEQDITLTMSGDLLGTLAYMSPEQALAHRVRIDGRTDVYSLGATLYELLTLRTAVRGKQRDEILREIAFDEPVSIRKLNPAVPWDLERIVMKAMEKNPDDRYSTAEAMAADLQRFLTQQPVLAQPVSWLQRGARWVRRRPGLVATTAITVLAYVIASATAGIVIWQARQEAVSQKRAAEISAQRARDQEQIAIQLAVQADNQRARVVDGFQAALDTIQEIESALRTEPRLMAVELAPLRADLLRRSQAAYERFLGQPNEDDPTILSGRRQAYIQLAEILSELGLYEQAIDRLSSARDLSERLSALAPNNENRFQLALVQANLGNAYRQIGRLSESEAAQLLAVKGLEELRALDAADERTRFNLATVRKNLGVLYHSTGRLADAERLYRDSQLIVEEMLRVKPSAKLRLSRNFSLANQGLLSMELGRPEEARQKLQEVIAACELLAQESEIANDPMLWFTWGAALSNLAKVHLRLDQLTESANRRQQAVQHWREAAERFPVRMEFRNELAKNICMQAELLAVLGDLKSAEAAFRAHIDLRMRNAAELPEADDARNALANSHSELADFLLDHDRPRDAVAAYQQSIEIGQRLEAAEYRYNLAGKYNNLALAWVQLKDIEQARDAFRRAISLREEQVKDNSKHPAHHVALAENYANLALLEFDASQLTEAIFSMTQAVSKVDEALKLESAHPQAMALREKYLADLAIWREKAKERRPDPPIHVPAPTDLE